MQMWVLSVFVVGTFCVYKKGTSVSLQDSRVLVGVSGIMFPIQVIEAK